VQRHGQYTPESESNMVAPTDNPSSLPSLDSGAGSGAGSGAMAQPSGVPDLANAAAAVSLRSVTKKYGPVTAIEHLTLDIPAGIYCCLLGPSGCGKTTALRLISGHETVTSGEVWIGDRCVNTLPPRQTQHGHDVSKLCLVSSQNRLAKY